MKKMKQEAGAGDEMDVAEVKGFRGEVTDSEFNVEVIGRLLQEELGVRGAVDEEEIRYEVAELMELAGIGHGLLSPGLCEQVLGWLDALP